MADPREAKKNRRRYRRPTLSVIELNANEVLTSNCKTNFDAVGALEVCSHASCANGGVVFGS